MTEIDNGKSILPEGRSLSSENPEKFRSDEAREALELLHTEIFPLPDENLTEKHEAKSSEPAKQN